MTAPSTARPYGADATVLTVASVVAGLTAYGFVVVGTRALGAEVFAPVSVLWSLWAISAAAITFPVQHWIIRTVEASGSERAVWSAVPAVWGATILLSLIVVIVTWAGRERLFGSPGIAFPVMAGCLPIGSVLLGFNRGLLAARRRFVAAAAAIAGENVLRFGLAVVAPVTMTATAMGWMLIAGFMVALVYPTTLYGSAGDSQGPRPVRLLGGVAGANAAAQVVLTSGPVVVSVLGGSGSLVTELFAMLAVLRAPHTLLLGVSARITAPLTSLAASSAERLRGVERRLVLVTFSVAILGSLLGPLIVPPVTVLVFDVGAEISTVAVALLTSGTVLALGGILEMLLLLAEGRGRRLGGAWLLGLLAGAAALVIPASPVLRVAVAFVAAEAVALAVMAQPRPLPVSTHSPS